MQDKRYPIRRQNLRRLIDDRFAGVDSAFAERYGYTRGRVGQFLSPTYNKGRSIGDRAARELERRIGLTHLSLDKEPLQKSKSQSGTTTCPVKTSLTVEELSRLTPQDIKEIEALILAKIYKKTINRL